MADETSLTANETGIYELNAQYSNECNYNQEIDVVSFLNTLSVNSSESIPASCSTVDDGKATKVDDHGATVVYYDSNQGECRLYAQQEIDLSKLNDKSKPIYIPNIFSPNNDGKNDHFFPMGSNEETYQYLQIFDRWGNLLFEKKLVTTIVLRMAGMAEVMENYLILVYTLTS